MVFGSQSFLIEIPVGFVSVNYSRVYCSGMKQLEFATARSHTSYVAWEYREYAWWWRAKTKDEQECERCLAVFLPCSSSPCFLPSATVSPLDRIHEADLLDVRVGGSLRSIFVCGRRHGGSVLRTCVSDTSFSLHNTFVSFLYLCEHSRVQKSFLQVMTERKSFP